MKAVTSIITSNVHITAKTVNCATVNCAG